MESNEVKQQTLTIQLSYTNGITLTWPILFDVKVIHSFIVKWILRQQTLDTNYICVKYNDIYGRSKHELESAWQKHGRSFLGEGQRNLFLLKYQT